MSAQHTPGPQHSNATAGHTPGPWTADPHPSDRTILIHGPSPEQKLIAECAPSSKFGMMLCAANADLIATAPELLDELGRMPNLIRIFRDHIATGNSPQDLELLGKMTVHAVRIETLIARATGETAP